MSKGGKRLPLDRAVRLANKVLFERYKGMRFILAGSIRRMKDEVGDIDAVVIDSEREGKQDNFFVGEVKFNVYFASEQSYGAMLMFATGPSGYNIGMRRKAKHMGLKLNRYGLFDRDTNELIASKTEDAIYESLGKRWKHPEQRGR